MSKISKAKKAAKLNNESAADNAANEAVKSKIPNYGKCCSCKFYGKPCHKTNEYIPRKAEKSCYKMKG